jgi:hypothetical protein
MISHRISRLVFAFAVGILVAVYSYRFVTDPGPAQERAREEAAVMAARQIITRYVAPGTHPEIVDPLAPDRVVGKSYVYPAGDGWDISGFYRRNPPDRWHPFLISVDANLSLASLSVRDTDAALAALAQSDPLFTVLP